MPYLIRNRRLRILVIAVRALGYTASAASGVTIVAVGNPPFTSSYVALALFLVAGGILSTGGIASGRWVGELLGLPLLATAMLCFAVMTAAEARSYGFWIGFPSAALLLAFSLLLSARFVDVHHLARSAVRMAKADSGHP